MLAILGISRQISGEGSVQAEQEVGQGFRNRGRHDAAQHYPECKVLENQDDASLVSVGQYASPLHAIRSIGDSHEICSCCCFETRAKFKTVTRASRN